MPAYENSKMVSVLMVNQELLVNHEAFDGLTWPEVFCALQKLREERAEAGLESFLQKDRELKSFEAHILESAGAPVRYALAELIDDGYRSAIERWLSGLR